MLEDAAGINVVAGADGKEKSVGIAKKLKPHVVPSGIQMHRLFGLDVTRG